jgi:hypothetical protein
VLHLFLGDVNITVVNRLDDDLGGLAINLASHAVAGTKNLLDGSLQLLGERLVAHGAGNVDDLIEADRLVVLDVLLLLAITRRLLESADDQGGGGGNDGDGSLTVLDGELDSHAQAFPVAGSLGNIFSDLLGRKTQRTDLGGESRRGTNLATSGTEVATIALVCKLDREACCVRT